MAGQLTIDTLRASSGVLATQNGMTGVCKAWAKFQGGNGNTGGVILGSFNVSSVTVNGTGDYTVNFTTAMPDANYSAVANCWNGGTGAGQLARSATAYYNSTASTSAVRVATFVTTTNSIENQLWVNVSVSGN